MKSGPKKRNKPIWEEMRVGRGGEVIGGKGWRKHWGDERRKKGRRSGC